MSCMCGCDDCPSCNIYYHLERIDAQDQANEEPMTETAIIIPEIDALAVKERIEPDGVAALHAKFAPHFQGFAALYPEAREVQADEPKKARALRLKVRAIRIASDDTRKKMNEDGLRRTRAVNGCHAILMQSLVPVEEELERIEKAEEIREKARKEKLAAERYEVLIVWTEHPEHFNLGEMPEAQFQELVAGMKAAHEAKIAAERAAEAKIAAEIEAELAERARIKAERDHLEQVAAQERAARQEAERKAAAELADAARLAKVEADRRDAAEKARRDAERKAREEAEAKAKAALAAERAERERIQAEIAAKEKAESDRIEQEKAAAKRAAAAPDQEKVRRFADVVGNLEVPELSDAAIQQKIKEQISAMNRWLVTLSSKIGE